MADFLRLIDVNAGGFRLNKGQGILHPIEAQSSKFEMQIALCNISHCWGMSESWEPNSLTFVNLDVLPMRQKKLLSCHTIWPLPLHHKKNITLQVVDPWEPIPSQLLSPLNILHYHQIGFNQWVSTPHCIVTFGISGQKHFRDTLHDGYIKYGL